MKYSELVQFDPIESVIQIRDADSEIKARKLVDTYVVSERMAERITDLVFPNLQFEVSHDTKGLLIVGNYGTGKSHLMAVISSIAEHSELSQLTRSDEVVSQSNNIAGKFKVIRTEIGATTMSLRDIIFTELEKHLNQLNVSYHFASISEVVSNKDLFIEMMSKFQEKYPEKGLLLVVDELLDYLRTRKEQELILDLNFLREIGEACKDARFRFIAGIQEALFDNPRFQFVAETVRRVSTRFEQVHIAREDVSYVVSERLLKKDSKQKALVREHLQQFCKLYGPLNERLEEFVNLFPVHPAYLSTFERVSVTEKREVLKSLTRAISGLLNLQVPPDEPGLVAYDHYWNDLKGNPSYRSDPAVREVIEKSQILENRIHQAFTRSQYKDIALSIIRALSVHRLTTGDIYSPIGASAEELRDDLCLFIPLPEEDADFLKTTVETVLREITKTVSGQFISANPDNGQYYLDLKKDIDYDSLIVQKADGLTPEQMDRYYFEALARAMECADSTYVSGYRIWEHELEWRDHKVTRLGYLFFGAPNERSTAQPPRDFYLYFVQPFEPPPISDENNTDEVFFRLTEKDDTLNNALKLYAGARELAYTATAGTRRIYEEKANNHLQHIVRWLRANMATTYEVTCKGVTKKLIDWPKGKGTAMSTVRDLINTVGSVCLNTHFSEISPEYPIFSILITTDNLTQATQDAVRCIASSMQVKTTQGTAVLEALQLLDGERLELSKSKYAKHVLSLFKGKGQGQVVNRNEVISDYKGVEYDNQFRLEPELVGVILAALVHSGDIILSLPGKKIDAADLDELTRIGIKEISNFKHIERPKDLPLAPLQALFDLLSIAKGLIVNEATRDDAVKQLQIRIIEMVNEIVQAEQQVESGLPCWGVNLLNELEQENYRRQLSELKSMLESLQPYNTPGKLKNFRLTTTQINGQKTSLNVLKQVKEISALGQDIAPFSSYLSTAEAILPTDDPWSETVRGERTILMAQLVDPQQRLSTDFRQRLRQKLADLKSTYVEEYSQLHKKCRLGATADQKKASLLNDSRLNQLRKLAGIELLPRAQLLDFQNRLAGLKTCFSLINEDLTNNPRCPHCDFRPVEEAISTSADITLNNLDDELDKLTANWTKTLLDNLTDPITQEAMTLLKTEQRSLIDNLLAQKQLPNDISNDFIVAIQEVLSGLEKLNIHVDDLKQALTTGSMPCTVSELRKRFEKYTESVTKGKDPNKVRIILE